ncbi:MAG: TonB-dependent receptor, partial [Betaproteobacteria bacterium]|nr:TonB-dependent receptor [Betaproteobacteria bacterium]
MTTHPFKQTCMAFAVLTLLAPATGLAEIENNSLNEVKVISTTPLPGIGSPLEELPTNVQSATSKNIADSQANNLADFLNKNFGSVHVNDNQGNPFQADVNYRGYTSSPLLGTPQGLSIYMDGVRMNQPFGDVVSWDLIPKSAIQGISLMPGSNPLFGLNTLGGALSIQTKDGISNPGTEAETVLGMHGRKSVEIQHGGVNENGVSYYFLGNKFTDNGWRDASGSDVNQIFSKFGWKDQKTDLKLTYAFSSSRLLGGGLQQENLLATNRSSVFTKEDVTKNSSNFLNLEGKRTINDSIFMTGNAYFRNALTATENADINEDSFNQAIYSSGQSGVSNYTLAQKNILLALDAAHGGAYTGAVTPGTTRNSRYSSTGFFPSTACISNANANDEPNEKCTGIFNTTRTDQNNFGISGQLNFLNDYDIGSNTLVLGAGFDKSKTKFNQGAQFGYLNADRSLQTVNAFANGTQTSEGGFNQQVDLHSDAHTFSVFGSNTLSTTNHLHLTLAARFNDSKLNNIDNLTDSSNATIASKLSAYCSGIAASSRPTWCVTGLADGRWPGTNNTLTASHSFRRMNPALGISFTPNSRFNPYASYSESNRAPTSIELGCADPDFGCRLPNSMAGDP